MWLVFAVIITRITDQKSSGLFRAQNYVYTYGAASHKFDHHYQRVAEPTTVLFVQCMCPGLDFCTSTQKSIPFPLFSMP